MVFERVQLARFNWVLKGNDIYMRCMYFYNGEQFLLVPRQTVYSFSGQFFFVLAHGLELLTVEQNHLEEHKN